MSDPLRTDGSRAFPAASEADRDAKIEQLLLAGLDHYFAAQYDFAISVWTRVLFLDRSHARARAYIERARSALAAAGAYSSVVWGPLDWRALLPLQGPPARAAGAAVARDPGIAPPRRGELALTRARALAADGHLRDALTTLDLVRPTDPQKPDADRLRGEIQLQLIALTSVPAQPPAESHPQRAKADRPVP